MRLLPQIIVISLCFSLSAIASIKDLKTGDILLQPLDCWVCSLIKLEENSKYAHIGVLVEKGKQKFVLEAIGEVRLTPIMDFLNRTKDMKTKILVRRSLLINDWHRQKFITLSSKYEKMFYDTQFRWNNYSNNTEEVYCSELVYKYLNELLDFKSLAPKRMEYRVNPKLWDAYFKGKTPRGELGVSPEDFVKSDDFFSIMLL
ncbi:MAG: YiiX/YebB-like N1pC/P60 family cysteine hydrolase [Bacteriovoracaceae bacterium]|nr:hypothetical protein [Halobacteriovoraceae bacterium]MDP7321678.1 YiiX/YebB-like N1pC/P60 family cysteine hydrolase [Bacteriovoracaceae bacterium]